MVSRAWAEEDFRFKQDWIQSVTKNVDMNLPESTEEFLSYRNKLFKLNGGKKKWQLKSD